jgi:transposase InsO family protein
MCRVGACGDNAAMESFFALLQKNVLGRCRWNSRHQMRLAIITSIERTYHRRKRQKRLGILTRNPDAPLAVRGTHRLA